MALENEIKSAIASHSMWKARLQAAVDTGNFDIPAEVVARDDECYFGQ
ncbi:MAG: hypothetical protein HYZ23_10245, partial [Chloroflexi bacterium]|nr:hypothetical protein [Chloroflexota bacterium]